MFCHVSVRLSVHRGVPHLARRVYPTWPGGVPQPASQSGPARGYPCQVQLRLRQGVPPPPGTGQQMEYLIRRCRYASCVHAGGLSCYGKTCSQNGSELVVLFVCKVPKLRFFLHFNRSTTMVSHSTRHWYNNLNKAHRNGLQNGPSTLIP